MRPIPVKGIEMDNEIVETVETENNSGKDLAKTIVIVAVTTVAVNVGISALASVAQKFQARRAAIAATKTDSEQ